MKLGLVQDEPPTGPSSAQLFDSVARPVVHNGRRSRPLRIGDPGDIALLQAFARGEFAIAGFRNRDIRALLFPKSTQAPVDECCRLASKVTRQLRLLRVHGLIRRVPKTHRYLLTKRGTLLTSALTAVRSANINKLLEQAA